MADREKVIKALENCNAPERCRDCPWEPCEEFDCKHSNYPDGLIGQALALLRAQEPRVMTLGEVRNWVNSDRVTREPVVIEIHGGVCAWIIDDEVREIPGEENLTSDLYGRTWRCWTSRPTDAQREATAWRS